MKKIIAGFIFMLIAICAHAQKDVTQFLGIPVDGSKYAMIQKLRGCLIMNVNIREPI